ncbi:hypothetical protein [Streptomyces sp. NPDC001480]|uniref:hypothetical protein n=1 Tax=Streptomyces sp. NPDC001480 TaxID=3364577 RepID=UPI0036C5EB3C
MTARRARLARRIGPGGHAGHGRAISCFEDAARSAPRRARQRAIHLDNLATALRQRHELTHDAHEPRRASAAHRASPRRLPRGSAERAQRLSNHGSTLMRPAALTGDRRHLDRAVRQLRRALDHTGTGDPRRA